MLAGLGAKTEERILKALAEKNRSPPTGGCSATGWGRCSPSSTCCGSTLRP